jgi:hypothetical protein
VAHALENKASYYGNGESFVFSLQPTAAVHRWTGVNNFFVISNLNNFAMGTYMLVYACMCMRMHVYAYAYSFTPHPSIQQLVAYVYSYVHTTYPTVHCTFFGKMFQ